MFGTIKASLVVVAGLLAATSAFARPHHIQAAHQPRSHEVARSVDKRATSSWSYFGCVTDSSSRALTGSTETSTGMTVETCLAYCGDKGYAYAGLEYSSQCYCGNTLSNKVGFQTADSDCSMACGGNSGEMCGASYRLSLWTTKSVSSTSLGCFSDSSSSRTLSAFELDNLSYLTPSNCAAYCYGMGYTYSGVEYSKQCFCGNSYVSGRSIASTSCNYACAGDSSSTCGGNNAINIYSLKAGSSTAAVVKVVTVSASTTTTSTSTTKASTTTTSTTAKTTSTTSSTTAKTTSTTSSTTAKTTSTTSSTTAKVTSTTSSTTAKTTSTTSTSKASTTTTSSTSTKASTTSTTATTTSTSASVSASTVGVASPPSATGTKYLYAHHMVGNTYSYTQDTWADDISQAYAAGIDGFALNYGSDSWQPARLASAYAAAKAQGSFKLFLSMDLSSLSCSSTTDLTNLVSTIATYASNSAQAKYNGSALLSTFSGADCTFGYSSASTGWTAFRSALTAKNVTVYFIPSIFSDTSTFSSNSWMEGEFNWNGGWPMGSTALDTSSDTTYMSALGNKTYMAAMSPAFFTYYGPNSYNKDWIYRSDDWLLARRFEQLIAMRSKIDLIELISWNDYGESHYIGPIRTDQPNSQGWTTGMPHTAWLDLVSYYAPAWKKGAYAAADDQMILWSRPHPKAATPSAPTNARPTYWSYTDDNLYVWVALKSAATVTITSGTNSAAFSLPSGVSKLSVASAVGAISGKIVRSSSTVKSYNSTGTFTYVATPTDYNYNYFVASV